MLERSEYEPFGHVLNRAGHDRPGYTGHVEDAATGLVQAQQRYYDPLLQIFYSVDPVTAQGDPVGQFPRYRYANHNPYTFTKGPHVGVHRPREMRDTMAPRDYPLGD